MTQRKNYLTSCTCLLRSVVSTSMLRRAFMLLGVFIPNPSNPSASHHLYSATILTGLRPARPGTRAGPAALLGPGGGGVRVPPATVTCVGSEHTHPQPPQGWWGVVLQQGSLGWALRGKGVLEMGHFGVCVWRYGARCAWKLGELQMHSNKVNVCTNCLTWLWQRSFAHKWPQQPLN